MEVRTTLSRTVAASFFAPVREYRAWLSSREGIVPCAALLCFLGYIAWVVGIPGDSAAHELTSELYNIVVPFFAAIAAWRAARHPALNPRTRNAWLLCTGGFVTLMAGGVIWFVYDYALGHRPAVSVADVLYLLYYPAVFLGFLRFPTARRSRGDLVKLWLDVGTVIVTGGAIIWYLVLDPLVDAGTVSTVLATLAVAYPVGDLVLLFTGVTVLLSSPTSTSRHAIQLLTLSGLAFFCSDLVLGYTVVQSGMYHTGSWTDLGWQSAMLLWFLAASHQRWRANHPVPEVATTREDTYTISLIPYIAVAVGYGLLAIVLRPYWHSLGELICPILLLTALVLARQIVAVRENQRLIAERFAQEARFRSLVQHASDVMTIIDRDGTIQFMSPAVKQVFGCSPAALIGSPVTALVHRDDVQIVSDFLEHLLLPYNQSPNRSPVPRTIIVRCQDRAGRWHSAETIATVMLEDPHIRGIVLNTRDVSERMALQSELAYQAYHDSLTQLANRLWFRMQLERALERVEDGTEDVAVLFLDLDNFKSINDSFGHTEGDRLLIEVANRLLHETRGSDTVARLGGDEFAILVGRVMSDADLVLIAERIASALQAPFILESGEVFSGASVGIARGRANTTVDELLRDADVAMYVSKRQHRGTYTIFEPTMQTQTLERLELETSLRHALERNELMLLFQPIVALTDRTLLGVEALVRWRHPQRGLLLPDAFIPIAEDSGLILPLGRWVLQEACTQGARWRTMLPADAPFSVAVNVSGQQLNQAAFIDDVATVLHTTGLPPSNLLLEVTESIIVRDTALTRERLNALKALGVRLAIDDFGTGYSSLSFLQQFPVDVLKIDKSFVDDVTNDDNGPAVTRTIVSLAQALLLQTVAEGIERQQQADALSAMGCGSAQGFYFSRPIQQKGIDALIQQNVQEAVHGLTHGENRRTNR